MRAPVATGPAAHEDQVAQVKVKIRSRHSRDSTGSFAQVAAPRRAMVRHQPWELGISRKFQRLDTQGQDPVTAWTRSRRARGLHL